jgi:hypothetical protein
VGLHRGRFNSLVQQVRFRLRQSLTLLCVYVSVGLVVAAQGQISLEESASGGILDMLVGGDQRHIEVTRVGVNQRLPSLSVRALAFDGDGVL